MKEIKKIFSAAVTGALGLSLFISSCGVQKVQVTTEESEANTEASIEDKIPVEEKTEEQLLAMAEKYKEKGPKYIFLFVGDGMSYAHYQLASYYFDSIGEDGAINFTEFGSTGTVTTYNETSLIPDSASTITAIASGNKTAMGVINEDSESDIEYRTIAEYIKKVCGYKIGIISSVGVNHATPAGFYAKTPDRNAYYDIGLDLIESDFDYFAGGNFILQNGPEGTSENLNKLAAKAGYTLLNDADRVYENLDKEKILLTTGCEYNENSLAYRIDRENGFTNNNTSLADLVRSGISYLGPDAFYFESSDEDIDDDSTEETEKEDKSKNTDYPDENQKDEDEAEEKENSGFFIMCEGGMIDWACHSNDAATMIYEMKDFCEAIDEALAFYEKYPDDTLILVTADHESGGLTLGYSETRYEMNLPLLKNQKISEAAYDNLYITNYKNDEVYFEGAMEDISELFGLTRSEYADSYTDPNLIYSEEELNAMHDAYQVTWDGYPKDSNGNTIQTADQYRKYGNCMPFTVSAIHILERKAGVDFSTYAHTAAPVPIYAKGVGAKKFRGTYDDTAIYEKLKNLKGLSYDDEEEE